MGFAVTNAQRDGGRQREKETPSSSDDAFAAYFGAGFDYGSDYGNAAFGADAFGDSADDGFDAFGDLNFGSYDYGTEAVDAAAVEESVAADEADAANRPSNNDADDGKTILPGNTANTNDRTNSAFNGWCWTNSGATKAAWAKTSAGTGQGKWVQCLGSGSACEVKVARKISDGTIVQVTSSCANEESCVANMKQNFNPGTTANNIYSQYVQQACKPFGAAVIGHVSSPTMNDQPASSVLNHVLQQKLELTQVMPTVLVHQEIESLTEHQIMLSIALQLLSMFSMIPHWMKHPAQPPQTNSQLLTTTPLSLEHSQTAAAHRSLSPKSKQSNSELLLLLLVNQLISIKFIIWTD